MKLRLFDPEGIKPSEYKNTYQELKRIPEFDNMAGSELIFIWHFANKTSPLMTITDQSKRVEKALSLSGWRISPEQEEKILKLQLGEGRERAVEKMSSFDPGARFLGHQALRTIFERYNEIIEKGPAGFKKIVGSGDDKEEIIDYAAFVNTSAKISSTLPDLINKMEEGFGVSIAGNIADDDDEGVSFHREWNLEKQS